MQKGLSGWQVIRRGHPHICRHAFLNCCSPLLSPSPPSSALKNRGAILLAAMSSPGHRHPSVAITSHSPRRPDAQAHTNTPSCRRHTEVEHRHHASRRKVQALARGGKPTSTPSRDRMRRPRRPAAPSDIGDGGGGGGMRPAAARIRVPPRGLAGATWEGRKFFFLRNTVDIYPFISSISDEAISSWIAGCKMLPLCKYASAYTSK
jgi:hypothetical protein